MCPACEDHDCPDCDPCNLLSDDPEEGDDEEDGDDTD
jgi:hypothetical protein